jgi:O-antigen/teichoic acid export membrane protein
MTFANRYLITLLSTVVRAILNFTVSISVAKYLMPEAYGNYQYLLSILTAVLIFTNLSTESAYFTFISKKKQNIKFHLTYFGWQFLQIIVVFGFILLINQEVYSLLFKNTDIGLILIALTAVFFVGNIQNTVNHVVESIRKTHFSQFASLFMAIIHLILVFSFINTGHLDINILFQVLIFEYILYTLIIIFIFKKYKIEIFSNISFDFKDVVNKFYIYSKPLFIFLIVAFIYKFIDRWLIQTYIGAEGQAFFAISMQFSTLTLLVTSSILKIFWKEISHSLERDNIDKTKKYFLAVSENLFIFTTVISSTLFFFSDNILNYFYTDDYGEASLVFKLMMLYPIVQSMGQLYSTYLLASEKTKLYRNISILFLIVGIFLSILIFSNFGMKMGIEGIAIKLLIIDVLSITVCEYYIMRGFGMRINLTRKIKYLTGIFLTTYVIYVFQQYLGFKFHFQVFLVGSFYVLPIGIYLFKNLKQQGLSND